ncbi:MAG: adenylate/guanylate cyclase domain-containing protein [Gallionella sp.]|nr:adenylate/guanylate cyclase domain-containing protein [Gallionella sp.]
MSDVLNKSPGMGALSLGFAVCVVLGLLVQHSGFGTRVDAIWIDANTRILRSAFPAPAIRDVVIVGIDETTVNRIKEPITLWHRHIGDFLRAMAEGQAAAAGLDIVLPDRSFNEILPGYDESLLTGILAARKNMPVVLAVTIDGNGKQRPLYRKFQLLAGEEGTGLALFPRDADQVVRRFDERLAENGSAVPTLVGQLARSLGVAPTAGLIDYSVGNAFSYVPLYTVLDWIRSNDTASLREQFKGKPVILGSVLPADDRLPQPVNLAAWEDNDNLAPGVIIQAQALRSILGSGLIKPVSSLIVLPLIVVAALWFFMELRAVTAMLVFLLWGGALFTALLWLFRQGWYVSSSGAFAATFFALAGRAGVDAGIKLKERLFLKRSFSGSVSPIVMEEILAGQLSPELGGERKYVCVLFADIRSFTTLSESMAPEKVITLLNRYFECVVAQIHKENGAVICFMGDGIMAIFGAPKPADNPSASGFTVAKAMQLEVGNLNKALVAEGMEPIEIGVGLHSGEAVIGHVGSSGRHDYTAIGDVTNVASRLEGITKEIGYSVACSRSVAEELGMPVELSPVGARSIKGHTPVEVYGWGQRHA